MTNTLEHLNVYKEFTTNHMDGNEKKQNLNHSIEPKVGHGVKRSFKIILIFLRKTPSYSAMPNSSTPWLYWNKVFDVTEYQA